MELLKAFSANYANAVVAVAAVGALLLASITLWFVRREFANKFRPYVVPEIVIEPIINSPSFGVSIIPRNIGPHPCEFRLTDIKLTIGDETHGTPSLADWVLLAPQHLEVRVPAGHVNEVGIQRVREARYKSNRIEVSFIMLTRSVEKRFEDAKSFSYEINVLGEKPFAAFRPEWQKKA